MNTMKSNLTLFIEYRSSDNQYHNAHGDDEELPQLFGFLSAHIND